MVKFMKNALRGSSAVAVALVLGQTAYGQTANPASAGMAPPQNAGSGIEDIIVTAQRQEQRLQETPIAISAFSERALETRNITNLQNITNFAPNVEISATKRPAGGSSAIAAFIRGVGTGDFQIPTDPAIGLYVDGVYIARTIGGLMSVADIERIEVLKGPQGTLFGRNTLGGAISVITTQPSLSGSAHGKVELRYGNYGRADAVASVNGPLIPGVLGGKFSFSSLNFNGWQRNLLTGERYGKEGRIISRGSLLWQASDGLRFQLTGDYTRQRQNGVNGQLIDQNPNFTAPSRFNEYAAPVLNPGLGLPAGSGIGPAWVTSSPRETYETAPNTDDADIWGVSLVSTLDLSSEIILKSTTAYRDLDSFIQVAGDGTPYAGNQAKSYATSKQFSQELELNGKAFDDVVKFVLGGYYFHENATAIRYGKSYEGTYAVTGLVSDARSQNEFYTLKAESMAAYGQANVDVGSGLEVVLGARINRDFKRYSAELVRAETNTVTNPKTFAEDHWTSFTPRVGVNYKVNNDLFLYASYAKGFKSGGFGTPYRGGAGIPSYSPENLTTYEAGLKSSWFDNHLTFNLAGFYSEYQGVQITILTQPDSFRTTQNGGDAEIYGFDLDLEAAPFDGLRINASLGYNHARFTSVTPEAVAASAANGLVHEAGTPLPYVPDWSASAGVQYAFDLGSLGTLTPRVDYAFKSKTILTLADPSTFQNAYSLWNAKLTFTPANNENVELSFIMNNVFDKTYYYYRNISRSTGNNLGQAGDPRLFMAQLRFKY